MQQPGNPSPFSSPPPSSKPPSLKDKDSTSLNNNGATSNGSGSKKKTLPTPKELVSHYESQGMDTTEASMKVIDDLQRILIKVVQSSSKTANKDKFSTEASRKLDTVNARLAIVDMKLDSKPGYPQMLGIGVASAAALRGISTVWPHVAGAAAQIWNSVAYWWNYSYQPRAMANPYNDRTVIVDNNALNNMHIATVGTTMSPTERAAWKIFCSLDVKYVLGG